MKAHYYGITPDFSIDVESANSIAQEMALPFLLSNKENEALKQENWSCIQQWKGIRMS